MLKTGILNPHVNSLLSRVRHTNTLVIADRAFPYWPMIETVDVSLIDNVPRMLDVLRAVRECAFFGKAWMAEEFLQTNTMAVVDEYAAAFEGVELSHEPHVQFKLRVPHAIGLIRSGETLAYANMILESA